MKRLILLFIFLFPAYLTKAQGFFLLKIDSSKLPNITVQYLLFDSSNHLQTEIQKQDFSIHRTGKKIEIQKITPPFMPTSFENVSIVLSIDISGSMFDERIKAAKEAALTFIQMTPLYAVEIAITSFDNMNYVNQDFTKNRAKLINAVKKIHAYGGTDYNQGLVKKPGGALQITQGAQYKRKIVLFLTDGLGTGSLNTITRMASKQKVEIYPITIGMPMPEILDKISKKTHTRSFPDISSIEKAKEVYMQILTTILGAQTGKIAFTIPYICLRDKKEITISYKNIHRILDLKYPTKMYRSLQTSTDLIDFGVIAPHDTAVIKFSIKAQNANFLINTLLKRDTSNNFHILNKQTYPFTLKKGRKKEFRIAYTPKDSNFIGDRIQFFSHTCPSPPLFIYAGKPPKNALKGNLKLIYPNGGEKLGLLSSSHIKWEGTDAFDKIKISLSVDSGLSYHNLGNARNWDYPFTIPNSQSNKCLIRLDHLLVSNKQYAYRRNKNLDYIHFINQNKMLFVHNRNYLGIFRKTNGQVYSELNLTPPPELIQVNEKANEIALIYPKKIEILDLTTFTKMLDIFPKKIFGLNLRKIHKKRVKTAAFGNENHFLATADQNGTLKVWDLKTNKQINKCSPFSRPISHILFCQDSLKIIVSARNDLKIYKLRKKLKLEKEFIFNSQIKAIKLLNNTLFIALSKGKINKIDLTTLSIIGRFPLMKSIRLMAISPQNDKIALVNNKKIAFFQLPNMKPLFNINKQSHFKSINFNSSGTQIATLSGRNVDIWSTYKRYHQSDISDSVFSIIGGLPIIKTVRIEPAFKHYSTSEYITNYIRNPNDYPIEIKKITIKDPKFKFGLISGFAPYVLPAKDSRSIEFSFISSTIGKDSAIVNIVTASDTLQAKINAITKELPFEIMNKNIDFGILNPLQTKQLNVPLLKNISDSTLTIEEVFEMGGNSDNFKIAQNLKGKKIKAGKILKFNAVYFAKQPGISSIGLKIKFKDYDFYATIVLYGKCITPKTIFLSGKIYDLLTNKTIKARLNVFDVEAQKKINIFSSDSVGNYRINLSVDRNYKIIAQADNYSPQTTALDLRSLQKDSLILHDFYLEPDYSLLSSVVFNLLFDTGKYKISAKGEEQIKSLVRYLNTQKSVKIEIIGYTDNKGSKGYNKKLSTNRAKAVRDFLIKNGIKVHRIRYSGKGSSKPIVENNSPEAMKQNRRVEIRFKK